MYKNQDYNNRNTAQGDITGWNISQFNIRQKS